MNGNTIRVRSLRTASQAEGCSLLYLAVDRQVIRAAVAPLARAPVLTVSEDPEFLDMGGMILLFRDAGRLQFEINAQSMQRAGLRASSKLMLLSRSAG